MDHAGRDTKLIVARHGLNSNLETVNIENFKHVSQQQYVQKENI